MKNILRILTLAMLFLASFSVFAVEFDRVIGGTDEELREFIAFMNLNHPDNNSVVYVSELPPAEHIPLALPLTPEIDIMGSIVHNNDTPFGEQQTIEVLGRTTATAVALGETINTMLDTAGWQREYLNIQPGVGFNTQGNAYGTYCITQGDVQYHMSFDVFNMGDAENRVNIRLVNPANPYECNRANGEEGTLPEPDSLIPGFSQVAGINIEANNGYGFYGPSISTQLTLDIPLEDALAFFNEQLANSQGWTLNTQEIGTGFAMSQWSVQGEENTWQATFSLVVSDTTQNRYVAQLIFAR